jgi:putative transposase
LVEKKTVNYKFLERKAMIEPEHPKLTILRQCDLLDISRSGYYYTACPVDPATLELMNKIDEQYTKTPYYGTRRMAVYLKGLGFSVDRKKVRRLYKLMGLVAIYPKPRLSTPGEGHKIYPYLLRGLHIDHPNHVWEADITYLRMKHGFMYLVAIMDVYSRHVMAWGISNSQDVQFCLETLKRAIERFGRPEIFNTDQGSQFTSNAFTEALLNEGIKISMDGKGRFLDNIFVERLWRNVKYEYLYLNIPENGVELYHGLEDYFNLYNHERPHQSLDWITPYKKYTEYIPKAA